MKTLQQEIENADKDYQQKLAKLRAEYAIREKLPQACKNWFVHIHSLWGKIGSIDNRYSGGESASLSEFLEIAEALPGIPLLTVKDKPFTSIIPEQGMPVYLADKHRGKDIDELPICPWCVKGDEHGRGTVTVTWVTLINGDMVEINYQLPFIMGLRYAYDTKIMQGHTLKENSRIEIDKSLYHILDSEGNSACGLNHPITYAKASSEYAQRVYLTWEPYNDPNTVTVADFAKALLSLNSQNKG